MAEEIVIVNNNEPTDIFQTIRTEWNNFMNNDVEIVPGYYFNQYEMIKLCHLYYNSKFEDNSLYLGREKLFFNIVKYRCIIASKLIDIDSKDIRLWPLNPKSRLGTCLLEKELKTWVKKNKVGESMNQVSDELPIYGSVFAKLAGKKSKIVDLRRFANDPTVERLNQSSFIIQKHYLTESELREKTKDGWENVDEVIKKFKTYNSMPSYEDGQDNTIISTNPYYIIHERYGEVPESWVKKGGNRNKKVRSMFLCAGVDDPIRNDKGEHIGENGLILFKSVWTKKTWPFKDFHYSKTRGRLLGVGLLEDLIAAQIRENEISNQKRAALEIGSMLLFQTAENSIIQNVLRDLETGDVLKKGKNGGLEPVANEPRSFNHFTAEEQRFDTLADRNSFAYDAAGGAPQPTSTPATNARIQDINTKSTFQYKRQGVSLVWQDFFNELVLPQVVQEMSKEHMLAYVGDYNELKNLDETYLIPFFKRENMLKRLFKGNVVTSEDDAQIEAQVRAKLKKMGETRWLEIKDALYKDLEFEFDIMIANEQEDVATTSGNLFTLLGQIASNPAILQDPVAKTLLLEWAQKIGINPAKIELAIIQSQAAPKPEQPGGQPLDLNRLTELMKANQVPQPANA